MERANKAARDRIRELKRKRPIYIEVPLREPENHDVNVTKRFEHERGPIVR